MRDFNFFSPYIETRKSHKDKTTYYIIIIGLLFFTSGLYYAWNIYHIMNINKQIAAIDSLLSSEKMMQGMKSYQEIQQKTKTLKDYQVIIDDVNNRMINSYKINTALLDELSGLLPTTVEINIMSIASDRIQIQGTSKSRTAVAEYVYNLKSSKAFKVVHVANISQKADETGNFTFMLSCELEVGSTNENE